MEAKRLQVEAKKWYQMTNALECKYAQFSIVLRTERKTLLATANSVDEIKERLVDGVKIESCEIGVAWSDDKIILSGKTLCKLFGKENVFTEDECEIETAKAEPVIAAQQPKKERMSRKEFFTYSNLLKVYGNKNLLYEVLVLLNNNKKYKYRAKNEVELFANLPSGGKVIACWCQFGNAKNKPFPKLTPEETVNIFGGKNKVGRRSKQKAKREKQERQLAQQAKLQEV